MSTLPPLSSYSLGFEISSPFFVICKRIDLVFGKAYGDRTIQYEVLIPDGDSSFNLQRNECWNPIQKEAWIWSIVQGKVLPPISVNLTDTACEVIDGMQRLKTLVEFFTGRFPLKYEGSDYYFHNLPDEYQRVLARRDLQGYAAFNLTPLQKMEWFKFCSFAGTPQEQAHIEKIESLINAANNQDSSTP